MKRIKIGQTVFYHWENFDGKVVIEVPKDKATDGPVGTVFIEIPADDIKKLLLDHIIGRLSARLGDIIIEELETISNEDSASRD